jgi:GNAT superfamily N-acetyltransferase
MNLKITLEQPSTSDLDVIHAQLAQTYWAKGIPRATVDVAFGNSMCAIARTADGTIAGFARLITDGATFGWLTDVYVMPEHRGRGVGRALVRVFLDNPLLKNLRRWMLSTLDAHGVYSELGFQQLKEPQRLMHILNMPSPPKDQ